MDMEKIVSLCKRKGFIFPASEVYGGINGFWDYGPLGVELKKNIKDAWWQDMVRNPPPGPDGKEITMVGLDSAIIQNAKVWVASGHASGFQDPMVDCRTEGCKGRFRADHVKAMQCPLKPSKCPGEFEKCQLTEPRAFNLMFESHAGAIQDESNKVYLRPETAQGIFTNFKNVVDSCRVKPPFGIAQVGKSFRNEVNPRNYIFRSREFEQMEIEFFCSPADSMKWYEYWRNVRIAWYSKLGIRSDRLRPREQTEKERAFYSIGTVDIEYLFPFSEEPQELEGVAHRAAYDLTQHIQHSGKDLSYFDEAAWAGFDKTGIKGNKQAEAEAKAKFRYVPHVIEPSAGADRFLLAVLCEAYTEDQMDGETRVMMKFHPRLAPIKAAILPLVNKEGMPELAQKLYQQLKPFYNVQFDDGGAIGRRYRRQDEVGTPFCFTIDGQSMTDGTVTIRYRNDGKQERLKLEEVKGKLEAELMG